MRLLHHRELLGDMSPDFREVWKSLRVRSIVAWGVVVAISLGLAWLMAKGAPSF